MTIITAGSLRHRGIADAVRSTDDPVLRPSGHEKRSGSGSTTCWPTRCTCLSGSGFIYIFCHSYIDFFSNLHGFSVGQWVVSLPYLSLITIVFLWTMFKVPDITHIIFGGFGGVASGLREFICNRWPYGASWRLFLKEVHLCHYKPH